MNEVRFWWEGWDIENIKDSIPAIIQNCWDLLEHFSQGYINESWFTDAIAILKWVFDKHTIGVEKLNLDDIQQILILQKRLGGLLALQEHSANISWLSLSDIEKAISVVWARHDLWINNELIRDIDSLMRSRWSKPPAKEISKTKNYFADKILKLQFTNSDGSFSEPTELEFYEYVDALREKVWDVDELHWEIDRVIKLKDSFWSKIVSLQNSELLKWFIA